MRIDSWLSWGIRTRFDHLGVKGAGGLGWPAGFEGPRAFGGSTLGDLGESGLT
jgi:hypothetical protein